MAIEEQYRQCVAALFYDDLDRDGRIMVRKPAGTAFFVNVPLSSSVPRSKIYLVTARHVIDATRPFSSLYVRINLVDGGFQDIPAHPDSWVTHPTTDVAVASVSLPLAEYHLRTIPLEQMLTDEQIASWKFPKFGAGDKVFFVGLFSEFAGRERYQPIVRLGNIALMPYEPIPVRLYLDSEERTPIKAYLVEARSWGGHSGSPAFVWPNGIGYRLLGLVQGHYDINQKVKFLGDIGSGEVPVNTGIAIIIPAQAIVDTLMQEELVEYRKELERLLDEPTPTLDSESEL